MIQLSVNVRQMMKNKNVFYIIGSIILAIILFCQIFLLYLASTPTIKKPVLYLYPIENTNITVKFEHPEYLTTTYPNYTNGWSVNADIDGNLYDENGKYYYALYWEEKNNIKPSFKEGFYVEKKDAINFLEEKLSIIGLNDRERNEFIMYWLPILESNEKNLVYFELTESKEKKNKLIIEPQPDSLLRITMHVKKVNRKTNIIEQELPTFDRTGFVVVEWGGVNY